MAGAVAKGRQTVLLRKGGLQDKGGFQLEATTFLLLPNAFHSAQQLLAEDEVESLREVPACARCSTAVQRSAD